MSRISQLLPEHRFFPLIKQELLRIVNSVNRGFNSPGSNGSQLISVFETVGLSNSSPIKETPNGLLNRE
jgi:hypothetical protein